jgi:hypothetical protein
MPTTAPALPVLPADLSTATPPDIDAHFADLAAREWKIEERIDYAIAEAHRAIGERSRHVSRNRVEWPTTSEEALTKARELAATGPEDKPWTMDSARKAVEKYDAAMLDLYGLRKEREPLSAEWRRRGGWSRFYEVDNNNGHIHQSTSCQTCNRNGSRTRFGWHPELSGLTEVDAVAALGPILCSVCFPSAPVAWTLGREKPPACEGAKPQAGTDKFVGWKRTRYADCTQCKAEAVQVNDNGLLRRHKPVN